jgi:hypothetical protein
MISSGPGEDQMRKPALPVLFSGATEGVCKHRYHGVDGVDAKFIIDFFFLNENFTHWLFKIAMKNAPFIIG